MKRLITCLLLTAIVGCGSQDTKTSSPDTNANNNNQSAPGTAAETKSEKPAPPLIDIFTAAGSGNLLVINQHIAAGTELNQRTGDEQKSTPLIIAITFGQETTAKALITGKADLNLKNKDGNTALSVAAFLGYGNIVQLLLEAGADRNIKNNDGATALDIVQTPWNQIKPIYDYINGVLFQPLGLPLDYERIQAARPKIAEMLR